MSNFQAERAALYAKYPKESEAYESEFKELQARLAEAERDAARYRWLRDMRNNKPAYATSTGEREAERIVNRLFGFEWDHAIDAAMTADSASAVQEEGA